MLENVQENFVFIKGKIEMPLFKGQGCKGTPDKAIAYITDEKKAAIVSSRYMDNDRDYAEQFRDTAWLFNKGKNYNERKYYHFKLSCKRSDNVSAEAHHEYAEAMVDRLFHSHECVIATHTDTETVHSHIIVNAVNFENGRKLNIRNWEYVKMKELANKLGEERGFSPINFRKPSMQPTRAEQEIILRGGTSWKEELREIITKAKQETSNLTDFEKYLNNHNVLLTRNTDTTIVYKHPEKEKSIRGERLGCDYTKEAITNWFDDLQYSVETREETDDSINPIESYLEALRTEEYNLDNMIAMYCSTYKTNKQERNNDDYPDFED